MMLAKIKKLLRSTNSTNKAPSGDTSRDLVSLIGRIIHHAGLSSYTTVYKVHWLANLCTVCFIVACVLQIITIFIATDDVEKVFECFSVLTFCIMGVLKLHSLRKCHPNWRFLLNQISILESKQLDRSSISSVEYQSDDEESDKFSDYINDYTKKFIKVSLILTRFYSFTGAIFIVSPFVEHIMCKLLDMKCVKYPHILPCWAPLDELSIFGYLVTVLCEFLAAVYCVRVHNTFDLTAFGNMIFLCGQFTLLRDYSTRIGGKGKRHNLSRRRDDRARHRIIQCHHTNILLVNSITELDKLLKNILGVYFIVATLTLCSVAVRLKTEDMSLMQLVSLVQYMCGTLTQLFVFCRYGDAVLHASSVGMGEGPSVAALWCLSPRVRRDLTILTAGMMRPKHLRAGPFNYLDLPSFIQVVRAAYSYYAVLGKKT